SLTLTIPRRWAGKVFKLTATRSSNFTEKRVRISPTSQLRIPARKSSNGVQSPRLFLKQETLRRQRRKAFSLWRRELSIEKDFQTARFGAIAYRNRRNVLAPEMKDDWGREVAKEIRSGSTLPRRLFQLLYHLIDIVLISRRGRKRRFQNVRDVSFSVDYKPVRIVFHPAAPPQGAARNAVKRGCTTGRVRQGRGENQAFFLAEWPFAASEQQVLFFEDSGSIRIQRHHHIGGRAQFFDAVFLEAQLRLLVHSAASAVEGSEIDGDGLFAEHRRQLEGFSGRPA